MDTNLVIYYYEEDLSVYECPDAVVLSVNFWRKLRVGLNNIPLQFNYLVSFFGFIATLLTGIFALKGRIRPILEFLLNELDIKK